MKRCAFLTLDERGDFVIDDEHAIEPLKQHGWAVSQESWRQTKVPWSEFDAVIVRSTWDYWNDVPGFLDVLARIDRGSCLANPLDLIHWNLSKTYLRDLEGKGVDIVPTLWPDAVHARHLSSWSEQLHSSELVIKPVIGANGEDAFRLSGREAPERLARIVDCFRSRQAMVQPFMPRVLDEGEFSLFYFAGAFSHAIRKVPAPSEFRSQEERGAEILAAVPEADLLLRGQQALEAVATLPLYARIDMVRDATGEFRVMELELIEPSLYLRMDPGAPQRFARAIDAWFAAEAISG
jgi:glutathione synthase/RimK-type ligase-like ATP-grasp enzyme